eukprot:m.128271 g.128271  ORF g.128271 m.128271 type:complete len:723 (-) comp13023_c0_seq1:3216-5384(-)
MIFLISSGKLVTSAAGTVVRRGLTSHSFPFNLKQVLINKPSFTTIAPRSTSECCNRTVFDDNDEALPASLLSTTFSPARKSQTSPAFNALIRRGFSTQSEMEKKSDSKLSLLDSFFDKENITVKDTSSFNRWSLIPPAVAIHLSLGSVYAWSILNSSLTRELGVVSQSSGDWSVVDVVPIFSIICFVHGLSAGVFGKWQERVGPRRAGVYGALTFGAGLALAACGTEFHNLFLSLTSGVLIGCGIGFAYVPPVSTLVRWFPDKRGLANGLTVMGFGGGAVISSTAMSWFIKKFQEPPQFLGSVDKVDVITDETGMKLVEIGGAMKEVVIATEATLKTLTFEGLSEGVYLVGTGTTGTTMTLAALAVMYSTVMLASTLMMKVPPPHYHPKQDPVVDVALEHAKEKWTHKHEKSKHPMVSDKCVHVNDVMKTPQFWQIWTTFCSVSLAGMGMLSVANSMVIEMFQPSLPVVTVGFATTYVMALSAANLGGRLVWATVSDKIGRKNVFSLYTIGSIPLYASLPYFIHEAAATQSITPLFGYYASTMLLISLFGGSYSTTMAYEADVFGDKFVGAVHGRMLSASALGGLFGPTLITTFRNMKEKAAISDITSKVDVATFTEKFGTTPDNLDTLINNNSVSIPELLKIAPVGTFDPSPHLYDTALYSAAGLLVVAAVSNMLMRPVHPKYHMKDDDPSDILHPIIPDENLKEIVQPCDLHPSHSTDKR